MLPDPLICFSNDLSPEWFLLPLDNPPELAPRAPD
jgi:hypothetical protein